MVATTDHPVFEQPSDPEVRIWRYMDFTKFVAMIHDRALYFCRADLVSDPFEGSFPRTNKELRPELYGDHAEALEKAMTPFYQRCRGWTFINCWHINERESAAMWQLYAQTNEAIAISSRYQDLLEVLPEEALVGTVKYIDYEKEWMPEGNTLYPFVHKRRSFEHEREARAVIQDLPLGEHGGVDVNKEPEEPGRLIEVDLDTLIRRVHVAPTSPDWFLKLVEDVGRKYGLEVSVTRSSLDAEPVF